MKIKDEAFSLLREWCDTLIDHRVTLKRRELHGGILCPACSMIHGRCMELVLPFTYLYSETGDEKYLTAAQGVIAYAENNLRRPDGTYYNDVNHTWRGISAFSALAIGETLMRFSDLLDRQTAELWNKIFDRLTEASIALFENEYKSPNINYTAGMAALLALAYRLRGDGRYLALADMYEGKCRAQFDGSGLFVGEGRDKLGRTKKGCRPIDMGYNTEESLPLLLMHSEWLGDREKTDFYTARVLDHIALLLPDGGIDNSFGTRMNKWTYWGSRTSDGMHEGLVLAAKSSPVIARACLENFKLLKRCTHGGLLYAGLMQNAAGEPPCAHHTISHSKALAAFCLKINEEDFKNCEAAVLPRELDGIRLYQGGNVITLTRGDFIATVNASDAVERDGEDTGGGSLSLLWHKSYGAVLAATMHNYSPVEPYNMQFQRGSNRTECMTPRFVSGDYSSDLDRSVRLKESDYTVTAESTDFPVSFGYKFTGTYLEITLSSERDGVYLLPVIAHPDSAASVTDRSVKVGGLSLTATESITVRERQFNQVGGFVYLPTEIAVRSGKPLTVRIDVE